MKRESLMGLRGSCARDAEVLVKRALTLSPEKAQALSDMWELDTHPDYLFYCTLVSKALITADRTIPSGWFEKIFADVSWIDETKALHAIADAVMATLAKDLVPPVITQALLKPWVQVIGSEDSFLFNEVIYT